MTNSDKAFMEMMKEHALSMDERERLVYIVNTLWGSKYGWGKEVISDVDCSGSVSFALYCMGYNIRITAHDIYHTLCHDTIYHNAGTLAFWSESPGSRIKHVAVFADHEVLLNASGRFETIPFEDEINNRIAKGHHHMMKGRIDWNKVAQVAKEGQHAFGVDADLEPLFGVFSESNRKEQKYGRELGHDYYRGHSVV